MNVETAAESVLFTLPNGLEVKLHALDQIDFDVLCLWMKQTYLNDVSSAVADMEKTRRLEYIKRALDLAGRDDFYATRGQAMMFGTTEGLARIGYQLIENKQDITFSEFVGMLFPKHLFMVGGPASMKAGYNFIDKMITAVYGDSKDAMTVIKDGHN